MTPVSQSTNYSTNLQVIYYFNLHGIVIRVFSDIATVSNAKKIKAALKFFLILAAGILIMHSSTYLEGGIYQRLMLLFTRRSMVSFLRLKFFIFNA